MKNNSYTMDGNLDLANLEQIMGMYNQVDPTYLSLLQLVVQTGKYKENRTGVRTLGVFGSQSKYRINLNAFPILTTKKIFFKGIVHELLWFLKGDTNIRYLVINGVNIWNEWAYETYKKQLKNLCVSEEDTVYSMKDFILRIRDDEEFAKKYGDLGMGTYGSVWRRFPYYVEDEEGSIKINAVDQISKVIDKLKTNPNDRRMIVSAWHPYWVDHCALPPCHCLFHFNVEELTLIERRLEFQRRHYVFTPQQIRDEGLIKKLLESKNIPTHRLNCLLYQRSCDLFLGVPFNITSYSLLTAMMAQCVNMLPGTFIHTYGDLHIYENHLPQVKEQLFRSYKHLPQLELNPDIKDLFKFQYEDIKLKNYDSHPAIKAEIAV